MIECNFFWGSHGCSLDNTGHEVHVCDHLAPDGPCCRYDESAPEDARVAWFDRFEPESGAPIWGTPAAYVEGWRMS